ncbi:MAG TPA: D-alanine--D-alanine ligase [Gammaproteobacteria bacterium]|nr:D-alanine--D-alanine ligase [Gammaproteobacteria bacterium]
MLIGLTYDLKDDYLALGFSETDAAEFDSRETIDALQSALTSLGHACTPIGHVRALASRLVGGERWDLVFNIAEGRTGFGRESQVPALLEAYGVPYTFSDPLVCALTLHKAMAKHVARGCGVPTPEFALVTEPGDAARIDLPLPLFVKPVAEGTSKGITSASLVRSRNALTETCTQLLRAFNQPVLVERFLPGREFTVGILGTGIDARALATLEPRWRAGADAEIYSYRNKAQWRDLVDYVLLEPGPLRREVEAAALAAWRCLGCRDAGRVDLRLDEHDRPQMLEINPLAGLAPEHSDLPIMAALTGLDYNGLIAAILDCACRRLGLAGEVHLQRR